MPPAKLRQAQRLSKINRSSLLAAEPPFPGCAASCQAQHPSGDCSLVGTWPDQHIPYAPLTLPSQTLTTRQPRFPRLLLRRDAGHGFLQRLFGRKCPQRQGRAAAEPKASIVNRQATGQATEQERVSQGAKERCQKVPCWPVQVSPGHRRSVPGPLNRGSSCATPASASPTSPSSPAACCSAAERYLASVMAMTSVAVGPWPRQSKNT